ncbi:MAG: exopolysaccharide biosynthesis protein, partial [Myxococcota bacterium]|nr:exopolysaccharide biosynthesis protein [Myxococcota bacterium]
ILALPAALPLPAPGYATPFGIIMSVLGVQMIMGRTTPWLPERLRSRRISFRIVDFSIRNGGKLLLLVEWLIRPRLSVLAQNRAFLAAVAVIVVAMSLFMTLPIPLTNTAPSFVIFILAAGILEEDGLVLLAGLLLAPVAALIALAALYFGLRYGMDAVEGTVKPWIKGLLGL